MTLTISTYMSELFDIAKNHKKLQQDHNTLEISTKSDCPRKRSGNPYIENYGLPYSPAVFMAFAESSLFSSGF